MHSKQLLPSPREIHDAYPLLAAQSDFIQRKRQAIADILEGKDPRLLLIVGPCSIHDITAATEYATKLKSLADEVDDTFLIIMRTYFEKPRTKLGWKGLLLDPHLNGKTDIATGLALARELLLALAGIGIPAATEFLDPASSEYYGDLISWGCIGARTSSSQIHRQIASGLPMPIAFKNSIDGNIDIAIHGAQTASVSHTYIGMDPSGRIAMIHSPGNPHTHVMLRGSHTGPNYDVKTIRQTLQHLESVGCLQRVLVDCSHDNCQKRAEKQVEVFQTVIEHIQCGLKEVRGLMLESHLHAGSQPPGPLHTLQYGVSLTDPCLDWPMTEALIRWGRSQLAEADFVPSRVKI